MAFVHCTTCKKDNLPGEGGIKPFAEVPVSDGAEDLSQCFIIKAINGEDVQVTSEAA